MIKYILTFLLLFSLGTKISAQETEGEILYITDLLRLSLYEGADSKSNVMEYLTSGEKLIVTQSSGSYVFVTTEAGKNGWVKRGFLVSQVPTVLLFEQEQEKTKALVEELNRLADSKQIIEQYEKDMDALTRQLAIITENKDAVQAEIEMINQEKLDQQQQVALEIEAKQGKEEPLEALLTTIDTLKTIMISYWRYILPLLFGFTLIGYVLAKRMLESRIKKKFQGIKVW